ncbi:MAG: hypothetical protein A3D65_05590 [Candidatus Lloydbacteria bacterium RIFCSPHIGHO2_02_FULL_50_13]|uniref:Homing endonuclease LAGLIDADG domain-containing protein n=1 Tax=Candidatus Lloydbacteria bacterium RIFCSPHIGHO2_02_FULL_50_13 TaxID=1798661 RepID=A0A1G2DAP3_9BACT|nr:MAG: hypothetical protein A3D65_05590 [Candidatus Lloydbacteria bacterium RIFCSPHIGHO2_02_FULL_50_13]
MDNSVGRLRLLFPAHQFDVLIGSLLGDARLECRSLGIRDAKTARFRVHHGEKQAEYVQWKYDMLKNFVSAPPRAITRLDRKRNIFETSWYFHTKSTKKLGMLHDWFYTNNGVKQLPQQLEEVLSPRMLAVWYMDDGSYTGASCTLNTHALRNDEQHRVMEMFMDSFGIMCTLVKDRRQHKIRIGARGIQRFLDIVAPHVIPSMTYKIAYPRNDSSRMRDGVVAREASLPQLTRQL